MEAFLYLCEFHLKLRDVEKVAIYPAIYFHLFVLLCFIPSNNEPRVTGSS